MNKNRNRKYHACLIFKFLAKTTAGCGLLESYYFHGSLLSCTMYEYRLSHRLRPHSQETCYVCTDKKENKIFLIYRKFRSIGCKVIYEEGLPNNIRGNALIFSPYMRRLLVISDFAPAPSEFPNIWGKFSFLFYECGLRPERQYLRRTTLHPMPASMRSWYMC